MYTVTYREYWHVLVFLAWHCNTRLSYTVHVLTKTRLGPTTVRTDSARAGDPF